MISPEAPLNLLPKVQWALALSSLLDWGALFSPFSDEKWFPFSKGEKLLKRQWVTYKALRSQSTAWTGIKIFSASSAPLRGK
jgi:hypothetical protein